MDSHTVETGEGPIRLYSSRSNSNLWTLKINGTINSVIDLDEPQKLPKSHQYLAMRLGLNHCAETPSPTYFHVGAGLYGTQRAMCDVRPDSRHIVAEYNEHIISIVNEHLPLDESLNIETILGRGEDVFCVSPSPKIPRRNMVSEPPHKFPTFQAEDTLRRVAAAEASPGSVLASPSPSILTSKSTSTRPQRRSKRSARA